MKKILFDHPTPCVNCRRDIRLTLAVKNLIDYTGKETARYDDVAALIPGATIQEPQGTPLDAEVLLAGRCSHCTVMNYAKLKIDNGVVVGILPKSKSMLYVPDGKAAQ